MQGHSIANEGMQKVKLKCGRKNILQDFINTGDVIFCLRLFMGTYLMLQQKIVLKMLRNDEEQKNYGRAEELINKALIKV